MPAASRPGGRSLADRGARRVPAGAGTDSAQRGAESRASTTPSARRRALSLHFRPARPEEVGQAALLMSHSFPAVGRTLEQWVAALGGGPRGGVDVLWVGEEAGRLVAACRLLRFEQWIGGERLPVMGLGAVAIAPTQRRRGLAGKLVVGGFRHALERGDLATALYPFRTSFYQKLGYGMTGEVLQYQVPPESIPDAPERTRVRLVEGEADREAVRAVYDRWAPGQTGQMLRSPAAWEVVWEGDRAGVLYLAEDGEPEGYAVFRYHSSVPRGGRAVEVEEIAWLTPGARHGLHAWLGSLGDQWQQVIYRAHPDERFAERLKELRHPAVEVPRWHFWFPAAVLLQGPMFRLLDVPGAWRRRRVAPGGALALALEVEDPHLPENRGPWRIRLERGAVEVEPAGSGTVDASVSVGIEALSRVYAGALSLSAAVEAGLARLDRPERLPELDNLLRLPRPWTFDRF
jgi:predicted acetyltransferase